jgi:hypothetical protein
MRCEAHFTTHVTSESMLGARISPPFVRSLFLPAMSDPQPHDWMLPSPQQSSEPAWGESPIDALLVAAYRSAPDTLGTQAIPPITSQVPAPMRTTTKYPVHATLPVARGLQIPRSNQASVQNVRADFTFCYPQPVAHAPQEAVHSTVGIIEPGAPQPFLFHGLSPSASVVPDPPAPAWGDHPFSTEYAQDIQQRQFEFEMAPRSIYRTFFLRDRADVERRLIEPQRGDWQRGDWTTFRGKQSQGLLVRRLTSLRVSHDSRDGADCTHTFHRSTRLLGIPNTSHEPSSGHAAVPHEPSPSHAAVPTRWISAVDGSSHVEQHRGAYPW